MILASAYDAALFDLDGVIYLGPNAIPGVPEALEELSRYCRLGYVTNNASRTPEAVAQHLRELGIRAEATDVVNSTMATLRMLKEHLPPGSRVLPVGSAALTQQLSDAGYEVVERCTARPAAVVQGYDPRLSWPQLEEGVLAIQAGARWFVTNPDPTRPSERGIVPGCGAQADAIRLCVSVEPQMAGKPCPPLLQETVERIGAQRPIFVGDRLDTDVLGANNVSMDSLFVFTGAHGKWDLAAAEPQYRPTAIGWNVSALLEPARVASGDQEVRCGDQIVVATRGEVRLLTKPATLVEELDACWAALQLIWAGCDGTKALGALAGLP